MFLTTAVVAAGDAEQSLAKVGGPLEECLAVGLGLLLHVLLAQEALSGRSDTGHNRQNVVVDIIISNFF